MVLVRVADTLLYSAPSTFSTALYVTEVSVSLTVPPSRARNSFSPWSPLMLDTVLLPTVKFFAFTAV